MDEKPKTFDEVVEELRRKEAELYTFEERHWGMVLTDEHYIWLWNNFYAKDESELIK